MRSLEDRTLILLVIAVTLAFAWILWPFFSAVLWATVLAIVFTPLYRRILPSIGRHPNLAALATLLIVVTLVILAFFQKLPPRLVGIEACATRHPSGGHLGSELMAPTKPRETRTLAWNEL